MKNYFLLGLILLIFLGSRLYKITEIPQSVYWDEASIGYNAYSVTTDLKDEWGEFLPLHFRAFGEFKLPVYIYSVAILTKILGLGPLAVRLPAVFYGLGVVLLTYLLSVKITNDKRIGLAASFILTVSPWLFIFSRTGYEAIAGLFFFVLFIYFSLFYLEKRIFALPAALSAILAFYSYNSFRLLIPIFILIFVLYLFLNKKFKLDKKIYLEIIAVAIFALSIIPTAKLFYLDRGAARFVAVGVNKPQELITNYFSHYSFKFLFLTGDSNARHQQPGWGELYLIELPIFLVGLWKILKDRNKSNYLFLLFLIFAPIPAAIAKESPHALRSILLAPTFAAISSIGLWGLANTFKKQGGFIVLSVLLIYFFSFEQYGQDFLLKYNSLTASDWQYEYKEIFSKTKDGVITDKYAQPYIFALFYLKYPPEEFRNSVKYNSPDKWGFSTVASFGNFIFKKL